MLKVNTIKELREEQASLRFRKLFLETEIKKDVDELKSEFFSFNSISKGAEEVLASKKNNILGFSLGTLADFLTEKVLLRNSGIVTKLVLPFIIKKTTSSLVENSKARIVSWLGSFTSKLSGRKA